MGVGGGAVGVLIARTLFLLLDRGHVAGDVPPLLPAGSTGLRTRQPRASVPTRPQDLYLQLTSCVPTEQQLLQHESCPPHKQFSEAGISIRVILFPDNMFHTQQFPNMNVIQSI